MADETKNIFISHIHEDDEGLGKLKSLLKDNGMTTRDYSINADNPNNAHSEDYIKSDILAPRIRQSSTLAVYISPETKGSQWVDWEIEYAHKRPIFLHHAFDSQVRWLFIFRPKLKAASGWTGRLSMPINKTNKLWESGHTVKPAAKSLKH